MFRIGRGHAGGTSTGTDPPEQQQTSGGVANAKGPVSECLPTIKLIPYQDPRSNRPSLCFPAMTRIIPNEESVIRVGRYSERGAQPEPAPNAPSAAPIGFKSKVVSRRHCEFWCTQGQWFVRDVKSSSGTFLNHIRLSQPSVESKPFPINDGDVVQLGIDFRGGEEMIFRCVKIRIECNRGWQKVLNSYNVSTHKHLRELGRGAFNRGSDSASTHTSQECSICLMQISPCQALFVAPCSHVWHFKCIRPILNDHKLWPQFLCPNCRAITDLDAELDEPIEVVWDDEHHQVQESREVDTGASLDNEQDPRAENLIDPLSRLMSSETSRLPISDPMRHELDPVSQAQHQSLLNRRSGPLFVGTSIHIPSSHIDFSDSDFPTSAMGTGPIDETRAPTPGTETLSHEGPITPTNTAGPFIFDRFADTTGL